jgi:hypothetical protein
MHLSRFSFFLLLLLAGTLRAQNLVSTTLLGNRSKAQLSAAFSLPFSYDVRYYRVLYTMPDLKGKTDTVSGLLVIPLDSNRVFPRLVYQHGTSASSQDVPSFRTASGGEGTIGFLFGGLGYVAFLPDYLGLGVSKGVHPYVHAKTEADAAIRMMRACKELLPRYRTHINDQLFITGYSQGGHAAMALHKAIETDAALSSEFKVTAAAPLSGPYSLSGVMRDLITSDKTYLFPAYLPNTAISFQAAYGNIYQNLTDIFKPVYAAEIQKFVNKTITLTQLNTTLIALLTATEGASRPSRMFQPAVLTAVQTDPNHPVNAALRENDLFRWAAKAPTRIFYCMADDQVPFQNSIVARDTMKALGSVDLTATDINPTANHGGCFTPALTNAVLFFAGFQKISVSAPAVPARATLRLAPNPAGDHVLLRDLPASAQVLFFDAAGTLRTSVQLQNGGDQQIDTRSLPRGTYWIRCVTDEKILTGKVVLIR